MPGFSNAQKLALPESTPYGTPISFYDGITVGEAGDSRVLGVWTPLPDHINSHAAWRNKQDVILKWAGIITDPEQGVPLFMWGMFVPPENQPIYWTEDGETPFNTTWNFNQPLYIPPWGEGPAPDLQEGALQFFGGGDPSDEANWYDSLEELPPEQVLSSLTRSRGFKEEYGFVERNGFTEANGFTARNGF